MHPIASWMVTVSLHDELFLEALEPDSFSLYAIIWHKDARRKSEIDWSITKDLAVRAHLAVEEHVGRKLPIKMRLETRIPVGGGLGGGSSNAAAMLRALNELFDLKLSRETLRDIDTTDETRGRKHCYVFVSISSAIPSHNRLRASKERTAAASAICQRT